MKLDNDYSGLRFNSNQYTKLNWINILKSFPFLNRLKIDVKPRPQPHTFAIFLSTPLEQGCFLNTFTEKILRARLSPSKPVRRQVGMSKACLSKTGVLVRI